MRRDRRRFLAQTFALAGGAVATGLGRVAWGQTDFGVPNAADLMSRETKQAIERGLSFLASRQNKDGSMGTGDYSRNVGVCGLVGMALLAHGSTPGRGPYGEEVNRCLDYVLKNSQDSGFISEGGSVHGPMYGHGFATLFLAECYGMTGDSTVREALTSAVKLIVNTQNSDGGWRYQPRPREADISVTICQVMALRAARNAGVYVPNETIDRCTEYVKRSQNVDGGFMYQIQGGPSAFPRSAAGVVALYNAGLYEGEEIEKGLEYLMQHRPRVGERDDDGHFFYAHYYAVQAMWQAGGERWQLWYPAIRDVLLDRQRDDGSWQSDFSAEYGTAMAAIILQMPNSYLPIFQR